MTQGNGTLTIRLVHGTVSTDDILPARVKHQTSDPALMAAHVFESYAPGLAARLTDGSAIIGDDVFGIGSSREQAVSALKAAGVRLIVAPAFGRIFYRNCWNLGLPAVEVNLVGADAADGDLLEIALAEGVLTLLGKGRWPFPAVAARLLALHRAGGLLPLIANGTSP